MAFALNCFTRHNQLKKRSGKKKDGGLFAAIDPLGAICIFVSLAWKLIITVSRGVRAAISIDAY